MKSQIDKQTLEVIFKHRPHVEKLPGIGREPSLKFIVFEWYKSKGFTSEYATILRDKYIQEIVKELSNQGGENENN